MTAADSWLRGDGMTIAEVARKLRISTARVKQLEHRALEKIRANPGVLRELLGLNSHLGGDAGYHLGAKEGAHR